MATQRQAQATASKNLVNAMTEFVTAYSPTGITGGTATGTSGSTSTRGRRGTGASLAMAGGKPNIRKNAGGGRPGRRRGGQPGNANAAALTE